MKYEIIRNNDLDRFIKSVNNFVGVGWEPYGPLSSNVLQANGSPIFSQVVIKREEKDYQHLELAELKTYEPAPPEWVKVFAGLNL